MLKRVELIGFAQEETAEVFDSAQARTRVKTALVERLGLSSIARILEDDDPERARQEIEVVLRAILNSDGFSMINVTERGRLIREVLDEVCGLGPIQPLLEDPGITEVMINGRNAVFFEKAGSIHPSSHVFSSDEQILTVVDRILAPLGRRVDERNPLVNARLANGDRVNVVIPPVAVDGPMVTIRRFSRTTPRLDDLVGLQSLPGWYAWVLKQAVRSRADIAVAGGTGSGKTTLLNALSCEIDHSERIVTIEDSAELRFDSHPHVVRLESRDASIEGIGEVTIRELVRNALRMRPDRIVVGEVRGAEAIDLLQAVNTGHDGSLTTLHAGSAEEAVLRLVMMARFGMDLPTDIIEEQISTGLDLIVMSHRLPGGKRVIGSLSEVGRKTDGGVRLIDCISFEPSISTWTLIKEPEFILKALGERVLSEQEVESWRESLPSQLRSA